MTWGMQTRVCQHTGRLKARPRITLCTYHAVGDDGAWWWWQAWEQTHGMTTVHDQSLFLCHLTQVTHHQAELHTHRYTLHLFSLSTWLQTPILNESRVEHYLCPVTKHLSIPSVGDELLRELKGQEKWAELSFDRRLNSRRPQQRFNTIGQYVDLSCVWSSPEPLLGPGCSWSSA